MNLILSSLVPVFGIMLIGALAKRFNMLPKKGENVLAAYVLNIALPSLMFISIANTPSRDLLNFRFLFCVILVIILTYGLTFWISSIFTKSFRICAMRSVIATFPNTAFMGIPICLALFGPSSMITIVTINMLMMFVLSLTVVLVKIGNRSSNISISENLLLFLKQPFLVGVAAGILFSLIGISLPQSFSSIFSNIGATTAPCALLILGTSLNNFRLKKINREIILMSFVRLAAVPVLALIMLKLTGMEATLAGNTLILLSLSPAVAIQALSMEQKTYMLETTAILITSTIISALTLSCIIFALPYLWDGIRFIH